MAVIKNKEILQSYIITAAKYDFSIYEKRILYRQIEIEQELLSGQQLRPGVTIETNLWKDKKFTIPVKLLLNGEEDKNHARIRKAFKDLMSKIIEYETSDAFGAFPLIQRFDLDKRSEFVTWQVPNEIVEVIVNFAKGFRKYELKIAMEFESVYAMRFYELLSGQKSPLTYTIEHLKDMFKIQGKYKQINDFLRFVIEPAKRELDEKSPYSFEYKINKSGRKYHSITFIPKFQPQYQDEDLEHNRLQQQLSSRWTLSKQEIDYLHNNFGFTEEENRKNMDTFKDVLAVTDLLNELARIKSKINELNTKGKGIANVKGYVITSLRNTVTRIVEKVQGIPGEPGEEPTTPQQEPRQVSPMGLIDELSGMKNINNKILNNK